MSETVLLLSENGEELGFFDKLEAHRKGLLHSAFSVFLFNKKGEWLLHKRAKSKYHSAGLWSNACCSHPGKGEIIDFAKKRLSYEMGIEDCKLTFVFQFQYFVDLGEFKEHELDYIYLGIFNGIPQPNPDEVEDWHLIDFDTLQNNIENSPEQFTEWFKLIYQQVQYFYLENSHRLTEVH